MLTHLVLSVAALAMQAPAQPSGMVYGQVRSSATGEPLRYAVVEVVSANARNPIRAQTDGDGFYYLHNIPTGWRVLRASHIDHAPHEAEVHVRTGSRCMRWERLPDFEIARTGQSTCALRRSSASNFIAR